MIDRVPPQNIEAEQAVLGAMLLEREAIAKVMEKLRSEDFYREAHKVIFNAMLELYNRNEAVDLVTVTEVLKKNGKLEDVGGIAYVTSLANSVPTAANVVYHAGIVEEKIHSAPAGAFSYGNCGTWLRRQRRRKRHY